MEQIKLNAQFRAERGKGFARRLRMKGLMPAIFYGPKSEPIPLTLNTFELKKALSALTGKNAIINLNIENNGGLIKKVAILKDYQTDPVKRFYLHADFYEISLDKEIAVSVPLHLTGKPAGVDKGGILNQIQREVEVRCLPLDIPDSFDIDVSDLEMGRSILVSDVPLKEGLEVLTDGKLTVATVVAPAVEKEVERETPEMEAEEKGKEEKPTGETKDEKES
jgi:large subunit ribosomal protein L25